MNQEAVTISVNSSAEKNPELIEKGNSNERWRKSTRSDNNKKKNVKGELVKEVS